jgi:hypothetical protein
MKKVLEGTIAFIKKEWFLLIMVITIIVIAFLFESL